MDDSKTTRYMAVMMEEIKDNVQILMEAFALMQQNMKLLAQASDLEDVKSDVKTIKKIVTENNRQLNNHDKRITKLEARHST